MFSYFFKYLKREKFLADLVVSLKIRQIPPKKFPTENEIFLQPPKFLPANFDFFLNRQN